MEKNYRKNTATDLIRCARTEQNRAIINTARCDAANYLMFEFMYPQIDGAFFKETPSEESAGLAGVPIKELYKDKAFDRIMNNRS